MLVCMMKEEVGGMGLYRGKEGLNRECLEVNSSQ